MFSSSLWKSRKALLQYLSNYNNSSGQKLLREMIESNIDLIKLIDDLPRPFLLSLKKNGQQLSTEKILAEIQDNNFQYLIPVIVTPQGKQWMNRQIELLKEIAQKV